MFTKTMLTTLGMFAILTVGLAFAADCPPVLQNWTFVDNLVRYENGTSGLPGIYETTISGTVQVTRQYGVENCFYEGLITVQSALGPDGNNTLDPFYSTQVYPFTIPFIGSATSDGKTVRINRTAAVGNWHESGVSTNYNRALKAYTGSAYDITDTNLIGKGTSTAVVSP